MSNSGSERELELGYVDGTLSAQERELLAERMQADPAARADLESLQALARGLGELPEEAPPPGFAREFMERHAGGGLLERMKAWLDALPVPAPALATAGAGALAAALFLVVPGEAPAPARPLAGCTLVADAGSARVNQDPASAPETRLRLEDRIRVDEAFEGALVYPDGTRIKIRPGSELVVRARGIFLQEGGVWLNVTKDQRGFQVDTPVAMAAVKGTRFWVEVAQDAMKVVVDEGVVEVISRAARKLLSFGKGALVGPDREIEVFVERQGSHRMFQDAREGGFFLEE